MNYTYKRLLDALGQIFKEEPHLKNEIIVLSDGGNITGVQADMDILTKKVTMRIKVD